MTLEAIAAATGSAAAPAVTSAIAEATKKPKSAAAKKLVKKLAKKASAKTGKKAGPKSGKKVTRRASSDIPWAKIRDMYNAGKTKPEISDALGLTKKSSPFPYYLTAGYLKRLAVGVEVNGQKYSITRNRLEKKAAAAKKAAVKKAAKKAAAK